MECKGLLWRLTPQVTHRFCKRTVPLLAKTGGVLSPASGLGLGLLPYIAVWSLQWHWTVLAFLWFKIGIKLGFAVSRTLAPVSHGWVAVGRILEISHWLVCTQSPLSRGIRISFNDVPSWSTNPYLCLSNPFLFPYDHHHRYFLICGITLTCET